MRLRNRSGPKTHRKTRRRGAMRSNTPFPITKAAKRSSALFLHMLRSPPPIHLLSSSTLPSWLSSEPLTQVRLLLVTRLRLEKEPGCREPRRKGKLGFVLEGGIVSCPAYSTVTMTPKTNLSRSVAGHPFYSPRRVLLGNRASAKSHSRKLRGHK